MAEVRLAVEKEHRVDLLGARERQSARVYRGAEPQPEGDGNGDDDGERAAAHLASSRSMNCPTPASGRRSSMNRIADFGMSTDGSGWCSSVPRRTIFDSGGDWSSAAGVCWM